MNKLCKDLLAGESVAGWRASGGFWGLEPGYKGKRWGSGDKAVDLSSRQQWCQIHLQKDHSGVRVHPGEEQSCPSHGQWGKQPLLGMQGWGFKAVSGEGFREG